MPHISIKADVIYNLFGLPITNSMILSWVVLAVCIVLGRYYQSHITRKHKSTGFFLLHAFFSGIYGLISSILHEKTRKFYPLLAAYFFYILANNWFGLLPSVGSLLVEPVVSGIAHAASVDVHVVQPDTHTDATEDQVDGHMVETTGAHDEPAHLLPLLRANNADLNTTLALALITVFLIQYYGIQYNGLGGYMRKFLNFSSPIMFFVGILELISEVSRILSFSFRLFGNVLAGEVLIAIVAFLLPSVVSFFLVPFYALEIMAGAIQALVFMMISTVLLSMATQKAHH